MYGEKAEKKPKCYGNMDGYYTLNCEECKYADSCYHETFDELISEAL